jgi:hypothetical protein
MNDKTVKAIMKLQRDLSVILKGDKVAESKQSKSLRLFDIMIDSVTVGDCNICIYDSYSSGFRQNCDLFYKCGNRNDQIKACISIFG